MEVYNKDPDCHRFYDSENMIEYVFSGFDEPIPRTIKVQLIKKFGKPRRMKLDEVVFESSFAVITNPIPSWEIQMIHFQQEED